MTDQPNPDVPEADEREMNVRFALTELEHRTRIAIVLALLAEAGVIALAMILIVNRRQTDV